MLMGENVAEGIAKYQTRTWELRIQSLREDIEKVIESKIFKRVLNSQGIDEHVEIVWGLPSQEEKMENAKVLIEALKNPFLSEPMKIMLEQKLAKNFDISDDDIETMEEEREKEEEKEKQPIVPEQRIKKENIKLSKADFKTSNEVKDWLLNKKSKITETPSGYLITSGDDTMKHTHTPIIEDIHENYTIKDWVGFNYSDYLEDVIQMTRIDTFEQLKAVTNEMKKAGLLLSNEIEKVRITFEEGFRENLTIRDIQNRLKKRIDFKDRFAMSKGKIMTRKGKPIIAVKAKYRANMIARTETVRLSNLGAIENYKNGGVEKVRWISAVSDRTCPQCESLNGQIFEIAKAPRPPWHTLCRCSLSPVVD